MNKLLTILEDKGFIPNRERLRKEYSLAEFTEGKSGNIFLSALVVLMLSLALQMTVLETQSSEIKEFERLLEELKDDIEDSEERDTDKKILTDTLSALENFKNALPGSEEITPIINDIYNIAKDNRLKILRANYSTDIKKGSFINRHSMSFPIEGSYKSIKKFIYDIESLKHHLVINRITLKSGFGGKSNIGIDIGISVYLKADL